MAQAYLFVHFREKTDHQTCACSQVHRYADCQRTAEHPVAQHAVWKRNHGASSGTCLKEPDYVADRFHHFREKTTPDGEQVYFGISRDGFHWEAVNDGVPGAGQ